MIHGGLDTGGGGIGLHDTWALELHDTGEAGYMWEVGLHDTG